MCSIAARPDLGEPTLVPYEPAFGEAITGWLRTPNEASAWAALDRLPTLDDLARWHADREVVPFVWLAGGQVVGYGELWEDRALAEAEVARLVIAPHERGRGHGRAMTRALADEARRRGFSEIWLRVRPENAGARRAYEASGFVRATPAEESVFNAGQPHVYVWMRNRTA